MRRESAAVLTEELGVCAESTLMGLPPFRRRWLILAARSGVVETAMDINETSKAGSLHLRALSRLPFHPRFVLVSLTMKALEAVTSERVKSLEDFPTLRKILRARFDGADSPACLPFSSSVLLPFWHPPAQWNNRVTLFQELKSGQI